MTLNLLSVKNKRFNSKANEKATLKFFEIKTQRRLKKRCKFIIAVLSFLLFLLLLKPILIALGKFLDCKTSDKICDIVLVEGGSTISEFVMSEALSIYREKKAKTIWLTLHEYDLKPEVFGLNNYTRHVEFAFDSLGIPKQDYSIQKINVTDPYTYNTSLYLAPLLVQKNIKTVRILNDNFHIKRSYLTYKKTFKKYNIKVYPHTIQIYLNSKNWWKSGNGWRRIISEYIKLTFYWIHGYI